ncbi:MAG: molybdopterin-binding protein, partial [Elusimicrobiota bacterium]
MRFELICIGNELLTGKVNTHIAYIGEKLSTIGIKLGKATTVGDDLEKLTSVLKEAF